MTDLFNPDAPHSIVQVATGMKPRRKPTQAKGYAWKPGTGPAGETCKSCQHYTRVQHAKVYLKCGLMRAVWSNGPGTDIKASSPACEKWTANEQRMDNAPMSKHTEGPWRIEKVDGVHFVRCPAGETVCEIIKWTPQIDYADARLIAAAPEMYEALRQAKSALMWIINYDSEDRCLAKAIESAEAALAKATQTES